MYSKRRDYQNIQLDIFINHFCYQFCRAQTSYLYHQVCVQPCAVYNHQQIVLCTCSVLAQLSQLPPWFWQQTTEMNHSLRPIKPVHLLSSLMQCTASILTTCKFAITPGVNHLALCFSNSVLLLAVDSCSDDGCGKLKVSPNNVDELLESLICQGVTTKNSPKYSTNKLSNVCNYLHPEVKLAINRSTTQEVLHT